jgi:dolichol-phosphate mannosyltransferase
MDISVILPVVNERDNLRILIPRLQALLDREKLTYEIVVIDGNSTDGTREAADSMGARVVAERRRGYAGALETGFAEARGDFLLTLDADLSHDPDFVPKMWRARERADIVIASRYVRGGVAYSDWIRRSTSWFLNLALSRMLALPVLDVSSGFRLYRREAVQGLELESRNFEVQEEILVRAYTRGFSLGEVPFVYFPRGAGRSHAKLFSFGMDIARCALRMRKLRNLPDAADYDERAFYSLAPGERRRNRRRHEITVSWVRGCGRILDVGCGSSLIVQSLNYAIGMDTNLAKLRYLRNQGMPLVQGGAASLPFRAGVFDCLICSDIAMQLPMDDSLFAEMRRALRLGGTLIVGAREAAASAPHASNNGSPGSATGGPGNRGEANLTRRVLTEIMMHNGFAVEEVAHPAKSEMIMRCRKIELRERTRAGVAVRASSAA